MTHRPSRSSSVSRRNRSRTQTHPQIAVQPSVPTRVKRVSRFRPPRAASHPQQREDLTWPFPEESLQAFPRQQQPQQQQPNNNHPDLTTIVEDPSAVVQKPLHSQSLDLFPYDPASLPVGSAPTPTHFDPRADSEPSPYLTFQATATENQFNWTHSPEHRFEVEASQPTSDFPQDMSTLGYMGGVAHHFAPLEPAYGSHMDSSPFMMNSHHHHSSNQPVLPTPSSGPSSGYLPSFPSPGMLQSSPGLDRRASGGREILAPYQRSPYQPQQSSSLRTSPPLKAENPTLTPSSTPGYSHVQPMPSQPMNQLSYSTYPPPHHTYATSGDYTQTYGLPASSAQYSPASTYPPQYAAAAAAAQSMPGASDPSMPSMDASRNVRVLNSRPKPQCWEHGCNGRQFSTFSNLLRHQREKSGTAGKSYCPRCGAEFTRTTAMKGHMNNDKCKPRRTSDAS